MKLGLSKMQVRRTLKKLNESNEIETNRTPSYQLVTIVKYDDYQSCNINDNTQTTPNNNDNNDNNVNNDNNIRSTDIKFLKDAYVKKKKITSINL